MVRVRACFVSQISTSGHGMLSAWQAYKSWEKDALVLESVQGAIEKHTAKIAEREPFEAAVAASANDSTALLAAWQAFIAYEEKQISRCSSGAAAVLHRTPSVHAARERDRVRCVFERAVVQCCLYPMIWQVSLDSSLEP